jgi:hypothetical protein
MQCFSAPQGERPPTARRLAHRRTRRSSVLDRNRVRSILNDEGKNADRRRRKSVLIVLFVPSVERDGATSIDQDRWVVATLEVFGRVFGGATAFPKARGIWRDDARGGALIFDEPVVVHCYASVEDIEVESNLAVVGNFCRRMARATNQGEIGLVIGGEYLAIREQREE